MMVLILDLDGVLITTPMWKPDIMHADGYSEFNIKCVENLNRLLSLLDFEIWLSSTRRKTKTLKEFNVLFKARNINKEITGFLPEYMNASNRKEEIELFVSERKLSRFLILDDDTSLFGLGARIKPYLVHTELMKGFDNEKLQMAIRLIEN